MSLMSPQTIKSVSTVKGHKRHVLREGRSPMSDPSMWPICVCNYVEVDEDSVEEHESIDDIDNLCKNCRKRVINSGC